MFKELPVRLACQSWLTERKARFPVPDLESRKTAGASSDSSSLPTAQHAASTPFMFVNSTKHLSYRRSQEISVTVGKKLRFTLRHIPKQEVKHLQSL